MCALTIVKNMSSSSWKTGWKRSQAPLGDSLARVRLDGEVAGPEAGGE
jgi:hypothetical protein